MPLDPHVVSRKEIRLKTGTKSLLFGVHQFILHPVVVYIAWVWLYGRLPNWKETVCIIIHDWGYWGKVNMDDEDGKRYPETAARIAGWLFGPKYYDLCLYHSRHYARKVGEVPSLLCWADKYSIRFEPWWTILPRAWASGELFEYREIAAKAGSIPLSASHRDWYVWIQDRFMRLWVELREIIVSHANVERSKGFMKTQTLEEYRSALKAQGVPIEHVAMKCPMCGTIQSAQDLIAAGAGKSFDEVEKYLGFSCFGRWTHKKPPPRKKGTQHGCNWTLGGLFQFHDLEVVTPDGKKYPRFELATPEEAKAHSIRT